MKTQTLTKFLALTWAMIFIAHSKTQAAGKTTILPSKTEAEKNGIVQVIEPARTQQISTSLAPSVPSALAPSSSINEPSAGGLAPSPLKMQTKENSSEESSDLDPWKLGHSQKNRPHLTMGFGYVHSNWKKFSGSLKNGSLNVDIGFEREWMAAVEGGLHISMLSPASNSSSNENVRSFHVALASRYLLMPGKMRPFVGLGLGFGMYRVWSLKTETASTITYTKHTDGAIIGVFPELGLRMVTSDHTFLDLAGGYTGYLDHPKSRIGGANVLIRFGFHR